MNLLENELNRFSEENEALRDRLGIGESEEVDVSQVREKRREQLLQLQKDSRMLEKEVGVVNRCGLVRGSLHCHKICKCSMW